MLTNPESRLAINIIGGHEAVQQATDFVRELGRIVGPGEVDRRRVKVHPENKTGTDELIGIASAVTPYGRISELNLEIAEGILGIGHKRPLLEVVINDSWAAVGEIQHRAKVIGGTMVATAHFINYETDGKGNINTDEIRKTLDIFREELTGIHFAVLRLPEGVTTDFYTPDALSEGRTFLEGIHEYPPTEWGIPVFAVESYQPIQALAGLIAGNRTRPTYNRDHYSFVIAKMAEVSPIIGSRTDYSYGTELGSGKGILNVGSRRGFLTDERMNEGIAEAITNVFSENRRSSIVSDQTPKRDNLSRFEERISNAVVVQFRGGYFQLQRLPGGFFDDIRGLLDFEPEGRLLLSMVNHGTIDLPGEQTEMGRSRAVLVTRFFPGQFHTEKVQLLGPARETSAPVLTAGS